VQRSCTAEADKGELARIVASLDGDDTDGLLHSCLGEHDDAGGVLFHAEQAAACALHDFARAPVIQAYRSAEE